MKNIDLYKAFYRSVGYPLFLRMIKRPTISMLEARLKSQYFTREKIQEIQLCKLKKVLVNAAENVPYYRDTFHEIGFIPSDMKSLLEFEKLDFFITKDLIRENTDAFISEKSDRSKLSWHRTGGSTGEPLLFATDRLTDAASSSSFLRAINWFDVGLGAKCCFFWGSPTYIRQAEQSWKEKFYQLALNVKEKLVRRIVFLNYNIGESNYVEIFKKIEQFRPEYIKGMPSSLYQFSKLILENELKFESAKFKFVHSACEQLYDWQIEVIEKAFDCQVTNSYGLSELGDVAYSAPCGNLYLMDEDVYVELRSMDGGENEIIATQLNNMATPLIKYKTDDIATSIGDCSDSDINLRVLHGLKGRVHDFIVASDGSYVHGQFFTHLLVFEPGVDKFQVVQHSPFKLIILLIVKDDFNKLASETRLRFSVADYLGKEVNISFEYVKNIPLTPSGKHRWIISKIKN